MEVAEEMKKGKGAAAPTRSKARLTRSASKQYDRQGGRAASRPEPNGSKRERWVDDKGEPHRTRKAALKASAPGYMPRLASI